MLLGAPLDLGGASLGVDDAPATFRQCNVREKLESAGLTVQDAGDVAVTPRDQLQPGNPRLKYLDEIVRVNQAIASATETAARAGQRSVVIGGDHSICLGAVAGASAAFDGKIGLIYLDAHGDMNTDQTTPTGNIHGMHLASLMGFGAPELANVHGDFIKVPKQNLLHIGGSDLDQAEKDLITREGLQTFSLFDLLTNNLAPLLAMVDGLASRVDHIWISLDLDCIDEVYAPAAGMPNRKGLTYREIATIAEYVGTKCNVVGIDVVEYNPAQDIDDKTAELAIELIATFFGKSYSWYAGYLERNSVAN